jgi:multicomponent Na+:H+ antiporter subunit A
VSPLFLSLLALALASPLLWLIRPHRFAHIGWLAALPPAAITLWQLISLPAIAAGNEINASFWWSAQLGLEFALRLDGLAVFFGVIITGIGTVIAIYTGYYFEGEKRLGYFYALLFLFMTSMLGLVWADNLLLLFAFWEGTSITSYLLIAFKDSDRNAQDGARRAFLVTGLGGLAMLLGLVLLGVEAGTYSIREIVSMPGLVDTAIAPAAIALILLGAFTKSAQWPFHFWLPGAMSAPTPASAYLHSATMVKAGVYLLARMHPALSDHPLWLWSLAIVGSLTMLVGAYLALRQYDLKALLAYATVSQLGTFVGLLAYQDESAIVALVVAILAHALYKAPLFLVAGIIDHATGTRDMRRLANLRQALPFATTVGILAALSMAGIPLMFGFVAKELLIENSLHARETLGLLGTIGVATNLIAAIFTVAAGLILIWEVFFRRESDVKPQAEVHHAPSLPFVLPPLFLVIIGLAIPFFFPQIEALIFSLPATSIAASPIEVHLALWHGLNLTLGLSVVALVLGWFVFTQRHHIRGRFSATLTQLDGARRWEDSINSLYALATAVTRNVQGITLLQQARGLLIAAVVVMFFTLSAVRWPDDFPINWAVEPHVPEAIMASLTIFAAAITVVARTRLGAIISLGVVGIAITLFFVFHSAPDLAITQLLVDILTVVLLILVFYRIPPRAYRQPTQKVGARNIILSVAVGLLGFFFVLFTVSQPYFPVIGDYFLYNSVPLGHGANVVNVILVDFRAFDTYGEIVVLGIAAVGGYAVLRAGLLRSRPPTPLQDQHDMDDSTAQNVTKAH